MTKDHLFVAEEDGRILGVAAMTDGGRVTLNYVAPEARFSGVSKALIAEIERTAIALGCASCTLETTKTAERFYRTIGYQEQVGSSERILVKKLKD